MVLLGPSSPIQGWMSPLLASGCGEGLGRWQEDSGAQSSTNYQPAPTSLGQGLSWGVRSALGPVHVSFCFWPSVRLSPPFPEGRLLLSLRPWCLPTAFPARPHPGERVQVLTAQLCPLDPLHPSPYARWGPWAVSSHVHPGVTSCSQCPVSSLCPCPRVADSVQAAATAARHPPSVPDTRG